MGSFDDIMSLLATSGLPGRRVVDRDGAVVGTVTDTWPLDGGGLPELVLVKVGRRFGRLRYLPVAGAELLHPDALVVPFSRLEIEDAPDGEDRRWGEPGGVALAYWMGVGD